MFSCLSRVWVDFQRVACNGQRIYCDFSYEFVSPLWDQNREEPWPRWAATGSSQWQTGRGFITQTSLVGCISSTHCYLKQEPLAFFKAVPFMVWTSGEILYTKNIVLFKQSLWHGIQNHKMRLPNQLYQYRCIWCLMFHLDGKVYCLTKISGSMPPATL